MEIGGKNKKTNPDRWIAISFCTTESPYEKIEAPAWEASALRSGVRNTAIYYKPDQGSWVDNCALKPSVIADAIDEYRAVFDLVVFVDIDARFTGYPYIFDNVGYSPTIAARTFHTGELLSGTLAFSTNCNESLRVLDDWKAEQARSPGTWDQRTLQKVLAIERHKARFEELPPEYTHIFDDPKTKSGIITHYQKSRRYKNIPRK